MKWISIIIISFVCLFSNSLTAQNDIEYIYDDNGNRTIRRLLNMKQSELKTDTIDYKEDVLKEQLSVNDRLGETQISFFPNPVKQWLNIEVTGAEQWEIGEYALYNNSGKLIDKGQLSSDNRLDFKNYAPGLYLLEINVNQEKQTWKILKD
ncbi:T9SS type A sorting domain-containing protein [Lentimicrobium sp. S6]|uniref:T9SS type A sorting domain-containing protein n=1 Tax=Lentimicrobium sp. S6 TaxID=2735872 RepID=UPI0015546012|nr:T9SS type A sorting domain-containing protein [Lentimicrobium sp. S6]NPD47900.1 T9SS type A sorting domain-containing protein [Lentimicrobium sp. S6]